MAEREIDNTYQRKIYKDKKFDDKRTMKDEYTGETIYYGNKQDFKKKFKTNNTSDIDHAVALKIIQEKYFYLTEEEQRQIANKEYNLFITNSSLNRSKGKMTNHAFVIKTYKNKVGKRIPKEIRKNTVIFADVKDKSYDDMNLKTASNMISKEISSSIHLDMDAIDIYSKRKFKESLESLGSHNLLGDSFIGYDDIKKASESGRNVALPAAVSSTIHNIYMVAYEQKDIDEAAKDVLTTTGSVYLAHSVKTCCQKQVLKTTERLAGKEAAMYLNKALPPLYNNINTTLETGKSLYKLIDGQIDEEECVAQIAVGALGQIAFSAGEVLLPPLGGVLAQFMIEFVCNEIYMQVQAIKRVTKNNAQKVSKINALATEALIEIEKSQEILKTEIKHFYDDWDENTEKGFRLVHDAILNNNPEVVAAGYEMILTNFNKNVLFSSREEFDRFLESEEVLIF